MGVSCSGRIVLGAVSLLFLIVSFCLLVASASPRVIWFYAQQAASTTLIYTTVYGYFNCPDSTVGSANTCNNLQWFTDRINYLNSQNTQGSDPSELNATKNTWYTSQASIAFAALAMICVILSFCFTIAVLASWARTARYHAKATLIFNILSFFFILISWACVIGVTFSQKLYNFLLGVNGTPEANNVSVTWSSGLGCSLAAWFFTLIVIIMSVLMSKKFPEDKAPQAPMQPVVIAQPAVVMVPAPQPVVVVAQQQ